MNTKNTNRNKYIKNASDLIVNNDRIPKEFVTKLNINNPTSGETLIYNGSNWVNGPINWDEIVTDTPLDGQVLVYDGPNWTNGYPSLSNLSGINVTNLQNNDLLTHVNTDLVNVNYALSNLTDVSLSADSNNTLLKYDGSKYINTSLKFKEPTSSIQFIQSDPKTIRIGYNNHGTQLGYNNSINIGTNVGLINQGCNCISIGSNCGSNNQGSNSIVIGRESTNVSIGTNSVVIDIDEIQSDLKYGDKNTVIGSKNTNTAIAPTGLTAFGQCNYITTSCNATCFGYISGGNANRSYGVIFGYDSGNLNTSSIMIGDNNSRLNSTGVSNICIGSYNLSYSNNTIAIGRNLRCRGNHSINLGINMVTTGTNNVHHYSIGIGYLAYDLDRNSYNIAIGSNCANNCTTLSNICIGISSGSNLLNQRTINIGNLAGQCNPGIYGISIGYSCYSTAANSIILNASKNVFTKTTTGLFVSPGTIQGSNVATNSGELYYIPSTGEIKYATL